MKTAFAALVPLAILLLAAICCCDSQSFSQDVGGDFGRSWISSFKAQNPQPAQTNLKNELWSWGSSPKGSIIVNGNLMPDPYYIWKALNYSSGWLGIVYIDPATGYPVYGYINPHTGLPVYYYLDPKTRKTVYVDSYPYNGLPYNYVAPPYYTGDFPPAWNTPPAVFY
ncbi:MAG: hypothetical protein A4E49_01423 [Methanosaeta sp. PtaU1.Bin112]|nr:MAG: hypothetical protein A4E49_01423 [Methanosaeta sp. PtaU1.Bin112]